MMGDKQIQSCHIFLFPFMWNYSVKGDSENGCFSSKVNMQQVKKALKKWEYVGGSIDSNLKYNQYVYFYNSARNAILSRPRSVQKKPESQTVSNFEYKNSNGTYNIKIKGGSTYSLNIEAIKLKLYDTGIGILSYHLHTDENTKKPVGPLTERPILNEDDILLINDFGRRIYPQFLKLEFVKDQFLADELSILFESGETIVENFEYEETEHHQNPHRISKTVMCILGDKFKSIDEEGISEGNILIKPIIDDRMYTMCYLCNDGLSAHLREYDAEGYKYKKSEFWYKYIFIDGKSCTCKSEDMRRELLEAHTYDRWVNYGTLFGITRYSFMLLKNFEAEYLHDHFRTMYFEMVCLALAQRASTLRFSDEITAVASDSSPKLGERVRELRKHYILFINKLYCREISAQEQGIELYNKIMHAMNIEREIAEIDKGMEELHQYVTLIQNQKSNNILFILSILGTFFVIPSFLSGWLDLSGVLKAWAVLIWLAVSLFIWYILKRK